MEHHQWYMRAAKEIHIIGVDHLVQYRNGIVPAGVFEEFEGFLGLCARARGADCIAEEMSREALGEIYGAEESLAEGAARALGLAHIYCDPAAAERARLGISCYADLRDLARTVLGVGKYPPPDPSLVKKVEGAASGFDRATWPLRERFWLGALESSRRTVFVFLCGHEHVGGFGRLAGSRGHGVSVIDPFWQRDLFGDYSRLGL